MAKQSGIHQLRGKVGEHSYYRQTGIQSGLVRSINQGMSSRVKTDEAFANTRLNNAEFGQAGRLASVLAQYITPKFRPMVLPFSQSKMAKLILEYIKNDSTAPWGKRNLVPSNAREAQVAALNSVAKSRFDDFGLSLTIHEETRKLTGVMTAETINKLTAIGADGIAVRFITMSTWVGKYNDVTFRYSPSSAHLNVYDDSFYQPSAGDDFNINYQIPMAPPQVFPQFGIERTGLMIVLPFRTIYNQNRTLQEHCTFKAFAIEEGAVS